MDARLSPSMTGYQVIACPKTDQLGWHCACSFASGAGGMFRNAAGLCAHGVVKKQRERSGQDADARGSVWCQVFAVHIRSRRREAAA
jgi:hypothetical protein